MEWGGREVAEKVLLLTRWVGSWRLVLFNVSFGILFYGIPNTMNIANVCFLAIKSRILNTYLL